jgi:hypothetical protein
VNLILKLQCYLFRWKALLDETYPGISKKASTFISAISFEEIRSIATRRQRKCLQFIIYEILNKIEVKINYFETVQDCFNKTFWRKRNFWTLSGSQNELFVQTLKLWRKKEKTRKDGLKV